MPATVAAGDLLLVLFTNIDDSTVTTPGGWTLLFTESHDGDVRGSAYAKVATGSEGGTTVNFITSTNERAAAQVYRVLASEWYGSIASGISVGSATEADAVDPNPPSLTPSWSSADTLWIAYSGSEGVSVSSYPSSYSGGLTTASGGSGTHAQVASAYRQLNATSENPGIFDTASVDWVANTIAVRPFADTIAPTVTINQAIAQVDPTNASPINFTVVFSESVSNFVTGDVSLSGTAGATTGTVTGSGTTYNVAVSGMTGSGTVIASLNAGVASDAAGNLNTASTATDNQVTYDVTAPVLAEVAAVTTPTNDNTPSYNFSTTETGTITYGGGCSSVTPTAFPVNNIINFNALADGTYGTCTITVTDAVGNASIPLAVSSFTIDTVAPTATASLLSSNPTNASPVQFQVVFSESVTGFDASDLVVIGGSFSLSGTGSTYAVDVNPSAEGTVSVQVNASGATDAAGNGNTASGTASGVYDATAPNVSITSGPTEGSFINNNTPTFGFTATDALSSPVAAECRVDLGSFASCISPFITALLGDGLHTFDVRATDGATNVSATASRNFTVDTVQPSVTLSSAVLSLNTTNASPIVITAVFDESVTGVDSSDLSVTPAATLVTVSGSGTTYTFNVSPSVDGSTEISMNAAAGQDVAGNGSNGSPSIFVIPDYTAPVVTLSGSNPQTVLLNGTYSEAGASAVDAIDGAVSVSIVGTVDTGTLGTYPMDYVASDAAGNTATSTRTVNVVAACNDGFDNDEDGFTDFGGESSDPGCDSATDNNETNNAPDPEPNPQSDATPPTGGAGGIFSIVNNFSAPGFQAGSVLGAFATAEQEQAGFTQGEVLGASTSELALMCKNGRLLSSNLGLNRPNPVDQVKLLQAFLNAHQSAGLPESGVFGPMTFGAVQTFQSANAEEILTPWGLTQPTGYVGILTRYMIDKILCAADYPKPTVTQ